MSDEIFICLLGGDKDGQASDVKKAKELAKAIHD
jgi:putative component of toxin-antitoxin plasmid stabilization module